MNTAFPKFNSSLINSSSLKNFLKFDALCFLANGYVRNDRRSLPAKKKKKKLILTREKLKSYISAEMYLIGKLEHKGAALKF